MSKATWLYLAKSIYAGFVTIFVATAAICLCVKFILPHVWADYLEVLNAFRDEIDETDTGAYLTTVFFAFFPIFVFGLPLQAVMHRLRLDHVLWFIAAGPVAGGLPAWSIVSESTADEHGMGSLLYYGLTASDWHTIAFGAACGTTYALIFWLIRRPDLDAEPALQPVDAP
jgi:hypothetical protein